MNRSIKLFHGFSLLSELGGIGRWLHDLRFHEWFLVLPSALIFVAPIHRGMQGDAIEPSRRTRLSLKSRQGTPCLKQDFLGKILTLFAADRKGTCHLDDRSFVLLQPIGKERRDLLVAHGQPLIGGCVQAAHHFSWLCL
jgi:hypothetical protein